MPVKVDIKYNNTLLDTLTSSGNIEYDTENKYLANNLKIEFTGTEDATATANKILSGYTAYIADGSKATGTIPTYNGEYTEIRDWLCFTANTAGSTISILTLGVPTLGQNFQTSIDRLTWTEFIPNTTTITLSNIGDKVYFKGNNPNGINENQNIGMFLFNMTGSIAASGNIMSLIDNGVCTCTTIPNIACFRELFSGCEALTTAPKLPATTLTSNCYNGIFSGCTALTAAPELPATTLADNCYSYMFDGCIALTTALSILPATTLTPSCYSSMFSGCTALTTAPELPATTLADYCYSSMFSGCTALTAAPTLPATTLSIMCYYNMFWECTSLITAPALLPATTLASSCYSSMFSFCSSLTAAPALPATTLAENCYLQMFDHCVALVASPTLPATTLASGCYSFMFMGCSSLVNVPALPATTLTNRCYMGMFAYCESLIVSDTSGTGYTLTWRIPSAGTFVESIEQEGMFVECAGTRSSEDMAGEAGQSYTYYTQNPPIG